MKELVIEINEAKPLRRQERDEIIRKMIKYMGTTGTNYLLEFRSSKKPENSGRCCQKFHCTRNVTTEIIEATKYRF